MIIALTGCNLQDEVAPSNDAVYIVSVNNEDDETINDIEEKNIIYNDYVSNLDIDIENRKIIGSQKVSFTNKYETSLNEIYFNVNLNAFKENVEKPYFENFEPKIFESGIDYGYFNIITALVNNEPTSFSLDGTTLKIELKEPLLNDKTISISLQFESYVPKINHRTGANDYALWCGNFLPTLAVYDNGWQTTQYLKSGEPFFSEIANYAVTITTPTGYTVVGPGLKTINDFENKTTTTFNANLIREFAFTVSNNYKVTTYSSDSYSSNSGVTINIYYYSDLDSIFSALNTASKSLDHFIDVLGNYPYYELNIVEVGLFSEYGIGYPQVIFMDSDHLKGNAYFSTLSHTVGQQWLYGIIGVNPIKSTWIYKGVSKVLELEIFYDKETYHEKMLNDYKTTSENLKKYSDNGLRNSLDRYESWLHYCNVQCNRGKLMIYSLKLKMGEENFNNFLKQYYKKYSYKIVTEEIFIKEAEEFYGESLTDFFEGWLNDGEMPALS